MLENMMLDDRTDESAEPSRLFDDAFPEAEDVSSVPDGLSFYLRLMGRYPVPTPEEERSLIFRAYRGDRQAREELVVRNLRLSVLFASRILKRWKPYSVSFEDLIQSGNEGIMDAIDAFDPERFEVRFSTYAAWHIKKRIWRTLKFEDRVVRLPVHIEDRIGEYLSVVSTLRSRLTREPGVSEVAEALGVPQDAVHRLRSYVSGFMSLDAAAGDGDDELSLVDILPSCDPPQHERILWEEARPVLESVLACLSGDELTMLYDHVGIFAERKLPAEIGRERDMSARDAGIRISVAKAKVRLRLKRLKARKEHFL